MESPTAPVAAHAQPAAAPEPKAPVDTGAYLESRRAELRGEAPAPAPASEPAPAADPAPAAAPDRKVSKRQEQINTYERTIAELNQRIARLETQPREVPPAPAPAEVKPVTQAAYKRFLALPDAPKLNDFDSIEEHSAAMALFIADKRAEERASDQARQAETDSLTTAQRERADGFATRIKEAVTADPEFWEGISPEVQQLRPLNALKPGEAAGPHNLVAEELLSSPVAPQLMRHFSEHPDDLSRITAMPEAFAKLPASQRAIEHARWIVREIGKLESTLATPAAPPPAPLKLTSDNPPPAPRLGSKPNVPANETDAALARKDTGAYLAARRREEIAKRQGR